MKNTIFCTVLVLALALFSCSKETAIAPMQEQSIPELELSTQDQQSIFAARTTNNEAIKKQDAAGVAAIYTDNFFILTSTNGFFEGKERVGEIYQSVFDSRTDVLFVRTPTNITVNPDWNMASEQGNWIGTWKVDGEEIEVGGDYYAKWHKIEGQWKLRSEVYTQFECAGAVVCDNKPSLE